MKNNDLVKKTGTIILAGVVTAGSVAPSFAAGDSMAKAEAVKDSGKEPVVAKSEAKAKAKPANKAEAKQNLDEKTEVMKKAEAEKKAAAQKKKDIVDEMAVNSKKIESMSKELEGLKEDINVAEEERDKGFANIGSVTEHTKEAAEADVTTAESEVTGAKKALTDTEKAIKSKEAEVKKAEDNLVEIRDGFETAPETLISDAETDVAAKQSDVNSKKAERAALVEKIRSLTELKTAKEAEKVVAEEAASIAADKLAESLAAKETAEQNLKNAEKVLADLVKEDSAYAEADAKVKADQAVYDAAVAVRDEKAEALNAANKVVEEKTAELNAIIQNHAALKAEYDQINEDIKTGEARIEGARDAISTNTKAVADLKIRKAELEEELSGLKADLAVKEDTLAAKTSAYKSARNKAANAAKNYDRERAGAAAKVEEAENVLTERSVKFHDDLALKSYNDFILQPGLAKGQTVDEIAEWSFGYKEDYTLAGTIEYIKSGKIDNYFAQPGVEMAKKMGDELLKGAKISFRYENIKRSIELMRECNELRALPEHNAPALKVSPILMIQAAVSLRLYPELGYHSFIDRYCNFEAGVLENLAGAYRDPFDGWYHEEKAEQGGHYKSMLNTEDNITGFAYSNIYGSMYAQVFSNNIAHSRFEPDRFTEYVFTVDEYEAEFDAYVAKEKAALEKAKQNMAILEQGKTAYVNAMKAEEKAAKSQYDAALSARNAAKKNTDRVTSDISGADTAITNAENTITECNSTIETVTAEIAQNRTKLAEFAENHKGEDEVLDAKQAEVNEARTAADGKVAEYEAALKDMTAKAEILEESIGVRNGLSDDINKATADVEAKKAEAEAAGTAYTEAVADKEAKDNAVVEIGKEIASYEANISDENGNLRLAETALTEAEELLGTAEKALNTLEEKCATYFAAKKKVADVKAEKDALDVKKAEADSKVEAAEKKVVDLKKVLSEKTALAEAAKKVDMSEPETYSMFDELTALVKAVSDAEAEYKALDSQRMKTMAINFKLYDMIDIAEGELIVAEKEFQKAAAEYTIAKVDYETFVKAEAEKAAAEKAKAEAEKAQAALQQKEQESVQTIVVANTDVEQDAEEAETKEEKQPEKNEQKKPEETTIVQSKEDDTGMGIGKTAAVTAAAGVAGAAGIAAAVKAMKMFMLKKTK